MKLNWVVVIQEMARNLANELVADDDRQNQEDPLTDGARFQYVYFVDAKECTNGYR
ncbi:MAG TPA: hypothetical protein VEG37_02270 [Burkholderiales bacterium]|nr:hypothetical protein [Burkholderiales bacterium]